MDHPPPLRIAIVALADWRPAPWQSRLIGRLLRDQRFRLTCRIDGELTRALRKPSPLARTLLALEERLLGQRHDRALDSPALVAFSGLPHRDTAQGVDLALALGGLQLPAALLADLTFGELAVAFAGQAPGVSAPAAAMLAAPQDGLIAVDILARSAENPQYQSLKRASYNPKPLARMTGDYLAEKALLLLEAQLHAIARSRCLTEPRIQSAPVHFATILATPAQSSPVPAASIPATPAQTTPGQPPPGQVGSIQVASVQVASIQAVPVQAAPAADAAKIARDLSARASCIAATPRSMAAQPDMIPPPPARFAAPYGIIAAPSVIAPPLRADAHRPGISAPPPARSALGYAARALQTAAARGLGQIAARRGTARAWQIGLGVGGVDQLSPAKTLRLPRHHHTMADPFLFEHGDRLYLFYEATRADTDLGWIEVAEIRGEHLVRLGPALQAATHLSYPFVFAHEGEVFMLPETQQARRLEIWRATQFPLQWELYATAFEGKHLADSNLFQHQGQWWLFTNLSDHSLYQDHSAELYLFAVDGPALRQIEPHPQNPVVIGSDIARNAGAIIQENGRLFRASQVNAHGVYGFGLNLMQIDRLDRQSYAEHLYRRFTPADLPGAGALHHVSFGAGRHVIDVLSK